MKLLKKIVAAVMTIAVAATLILQVRPYDVSADDVQMKMDESIVTGWCYLEGLNVRINCANTDLNLSEVYGVRVTFGNAGTIFSNGAGGGIAIAVPSKNWWSDQVGYSNAGGDGPTFVQQVAGTDDYTVTYLCTEPAFPETDIAAHQGGFTCAQWWGTALTAIKVEVLGQDGTVLLSSPAAEVPEEPEDSSYGVDETINLVDVTLENLDSAIQDKNMTLEGEPISNKCVGLKPQTGKEAKVEFEVEVEKAGKYAIEVVYAAKNDYPRPMAVKVNGGAATDVELTATDAHEHCDIVTINVNLAAGKNTITFTQASNFDGTTVKTPNLVSAKVSLVQADTQTPVAPETGVSSVICLICAVAVCVCAVAVVKTKKKDNE